MRMAAPDPRHPVPLTEIDLFDPDRYGTGSQHPAWHTLRREAPMWSQETAGGRRFWSATRHAEVSAILMDDRRFSSEYGTILAVAGGDSAGGKTINLMDQPRHADVRLPTMRLMSTHVMRQNTEEIRANIRDVWGPALDEGGEWDVAQLALSLPTAAIGTVLGIPRDVWADLPRWTMAGVAPGDPHYALGSTETETLKKAHYELFALFSDLIRVRRRRRSGDLISTLLDLDFGGRRLDDHEVLLNCYSFTMGAVTTTPHVASHWLLAMAEQPEAWRRLRQDPALVPAAVEEALRWASPTNHLMRRTRVPVTVGGVDLAEGELVCAWVASANRDEAVFDDPYRFDPARELNPHVGLGIGAHRCIGGPAAQVALGVFMTEVVGAVGQIELIGDVGHLFSNFINGITHMQVGFHR